ncbi:MAG: DUF4845 domain-containing protein [Steroidobacteraceae bacterium]|nr:DUF4845 domain-containing protein [Steroidobacteraceae bacterium]
MHRQQRGITLIGWIFLLAPVAIVGYAVLRLTPIYLNYTKVVRSMEQLAEAAKADSGVNAQQLRYDIEKRLDIESVSFPQAKDFVIRREGQSWVIEVAYEDAAPLISNVSLLVAFRKAVRIGQAPE